MTEEVQLGLYRFARHVGWGLLPSTIQIADVPAIAVDSQDRLFVFTRADNPIVVLEPDGSFVTTWGQGMFTRPHGLHIGPDDRVYCVDDEGQRVRIFTPDGQHLGDINGVDQSAVTGYVPGYPHSVRRSAPPFCYPTGASIGADGVSLLVSDGYGNARVHLFGPDRALRHSWGEPGAAPGEFVIPHGVFSDASGLLLVSDRENERIQVFSANGNLVGVWTGVNCPNNLVRYPDGNYFVVELGRRVQGSPPDIRLVPDALPPRLSVRDGAGVLLGQWSPEAAGDGMFFAPHGIAIDSRGDLYVGEVVAAFSQGAAPPGLPTLTKFVRLE